MGELLTAKSAKKSYLISVGLGLTRGLCLQVVGCIGLPIRRFTV
jgi:hypothetical protein